MPVRVPRVSDWCVKTWPEWRPTVRRTTRACATRRAACAVLALLISGCALQPAVAPGYAGSIATVRDSGQHEDSDKGQIFALVALDGRPIAQSFHASAAASDGLGGALRLVLSERRVSTHPVRATLRASHATGTLHHALGSRLVRSFWSFETEVDFAPQPNHVYVVRGTLSARDSTLWIEDADSGEPVTPVQRAR